jgi:tRNA(His) guanylyltransferase
MDSLGDRMKGQYETRTCYLLPRRTYTIIRIDGKAFHSYTRNLERPFDSRLIDVVDRTAVSLCKTIQGSNLGYVQSDEISILLTDFATIDTAAWYDNNLQKITSVSASLATMAFNRAAAEVGFDNTATFDARAFTIPDREEVLNYFIWRQQDAVRNSIQAVAQSLYSPKELHGKNSSDLQEMMFVKGVNWSEDFVPRCKRGSAIVKTYIPGGCEAGPRSEWVADPSTPIFTKDRDYLGSRIPVLGYGSEKEPVVTLDSVPGPAHS